MSGAQENSATFEDVDEDTFVRFCQFAYIGDYVSAEPEIVLDSPSTAKTFQSTTSASSSREASVDAPVDEAPVEDDAPAAKDAPVKEDASAEPVDVIWSRARPWDFNSQISPKRGKGRYNVIEAPNQSKKSILWDSFKCRIYIPTPVNPGPQNNREPCEDFTEVFLCHARLYVFGHKWDIKSLKDLSLQKLQHTLVQFTLYPERTEDVIDLLRYTYSNTSDHFEPVDSLRSLIIHYVACVVEDLSQDMQFPKLLEEFGQLSRDLVAQMLQRLD